MVNNAVANAINNGVEILGNVKGSLKGITDADYKKHFDIGNKKGKEDAEKIMKERAEKLGYDQGVNEVIRLNNPLNNDEAKENRENDNSDLDSNSEASNNRSEDMEEDKEELKGIEDIEGYINEALKRINIVFKNTENEIINERNNIRRYLRNKPKSLLAKIIIKLKLYNPRNEGYFNINDNPQQPGMDDVLSQDESDFGRSSNSRNRDLSFSSNRDREEVKQNHSRALSVNIRRNRRVIQAQNQNRNRNIQNHRINNRVQNINVDVSLDDEFEIRIDS